MSIRTAAADWWRLQKTYRCRDHGHRLHFGLPLVGLGDGLLHDQDRCQPRVRADGSPTGCGPVLRRGVDA